VQDIQFEFSATDAGRQVAQVADLLSREPGGAQGRLFGGDELGGGRRVIPEEGDEASVDGPCGFGRELLAHDGAHEGAVGVVGAAAAARRMIERADALDERGHDRVGTLQQKAKARVLGGVRGLSGFRIYLLTGRRRAWLPGSSSPGSTSARR
jgi:hypothetical protein